MLCCFFGPMEEWGHVKIVKVQEQGRISMGVLERMVMMGWITMSKRGGCRDK